MIKQEKYLERTLEQNITKLAYGISILQLISLQDVLQDIINI